MFMLKHIWEDKVRKSYNSLVKWVNSDVPNDWLNWSINDRVLWWSDPTIREAFSKLGRTRKRDRISAIEVWAEFYGYMDNTCEHRYAISINKMLASIPTLERVEGCIRCGPYGIQKGFKIHHLDE